MGLILDTSVLIAAERHKLDLASLFSANPEESFHIAAITAAELLHGVFRAQPATRKKERSAFVEAVLSEIETIEFDLPTARRHAELWASLEKVGRRVGPYDLLIAATALNHEYSLATLNVSEFERIPGLKLADTARFVVA